MSINKLALIRYKTIDNCLQNRFRKWTLDDLVEACSDALYEYEGITQGVSKRAIQLDLQNMRSEKLGYNAPIIVTDKKFYTYAEKGFSISNVPLTKQDLGTLNEVVAVLKQFKGFGYFQELTVMVSKLEDKLFSQQHKGKAYINFEKNDLLKGLEFIDPIHKAIVSNKAIEINYKSFKAREANKFVFSPYLLKEYRNRWFILGAKSNKSILTLALDRIIDITEAKEKYLKNTTINIDTYYDDVIGVTKGLTQRDYNIVLWVDKVNAPYICTKPLHSTQKIVKEYENGMIFSIKVIWNFELEREILGFGESMQVLAPRRLKNKIAEKLKLASARYAKPFDLEYDLAGGKK